MAPHSNPTWRSTTLKVFSCQIYSYIIILSPYLTFLTPVPKNNKNRPFPNPKLSPLVIQNLTISENYFPQNHLYKFSSLAFPLDKKTYSSYFSKTRNILEVGYIRIFFLRLVRDVRLRSVDFQLCNNLSVLNFCRHVGILNSSTRNVPFKY